VNPSGSQDRSGGSHGLCHQEAPQAHGEEEAPQAPSQDAPPAAQQEVALRSVTLIGKPGCHLCDDAREVIERVLDEFDGIELVERSIVDDTRLRDQYAEEIPVVLIDGVQHTYWRVDADRLRAALRA